MLSALDEKGSGLLWQALLEHVQHRLVFLEEPVQLLEVVVVGALRLPSVMDRRAVGIRPRIVNQDLRLAARTLCQSPKFTLIAIQKTNEMTFSGDEVDAFLPKELNRRLWP
jgi:hypothetical protein